MGTCDIFFSESSNGQDGVRKTLDEAPTDPRVQQIFAQYAMIALEDPKLQDKIRSILENGVASEKLTHEGEAITEQSMVPDAREANIIDDYKRQLEQAESRQKTVEKILKEAEESLNEKDEKITSLEKEKAGLQEKIDTLSQRKDELLQKIDEREKNESKLQKEKENLSVENESLHGQLLQRESEHKKLEVILQNERTTKQQEIDSLGNKLCETEERLKKKDKDLQTAAQALAPFEELLDCFSTYQRLPKTAREDLHNVLPDSDPVLFLSYGCQIGNILSLWDYVRGRIEQMPQERIDNWRTILTWFVRQVNALTNSPPYEIMDKEIGTYFDDSRHQRSSDCSRHTAPVHEVLWPGIWNKNRKIAEKKTLVRF